MIARPSTVEDVAESEEAICWRRGREALPFLESIAGPAKHDDSADFLMNGETRGGR